MASPFIAPTSIIVNDLTIRCYQLGDGAALRTATVTSYKHLRPWMPWATPEDTVEACEERCRRFYARYLLNEDFVLSIWLGDELAGGTGFHLRGNDLDLRVADIGMWITARAAGQGQGTRALRTMLDWGFSEWGWERLTWHCDTRNIASARVAQKGGMTLEGTLRSNMIDVHGERRDTFVFAMLREEWRARQP